MMWICEGEVSVRSTCSSSKKNVSRAERQLLSRKRDVDDVLRERAVELGALEGRLATGDGVLDRPARRVEGHARLAVADLAKLVRRRCGLDRAQGVTLERFRVHARDCIACVTHVRPRLSWRIGCASSAGPRHGAEAR